MPSLMFVSMAGAYSREGWKDKHSSLLLTFVSSVRKKSYYIGPRSNKLERLQHKHPSIHIIESLAGVKYTLLSYTMGLKHSSFLPDVKSLSNDLVHAEDVGSLYGLAA
jgi:hypothetical protein